MRADGLVAIDGDSMDGQEVLVPAAAVREGDVAPAADP